MNFQDIDFAAKRPLPGWLLPSLALVLVTLSWGLYRYVALEQASAALKSQAVSQRQVLLRQSEVPVSAAPELPKERVKAINEAIVSLNTPWPALLGGIESARLGDVALTRVEPRPKDQSVLVTAQADDMGALLDFMQRMSSTPPFVRARPVRQELVVEGGMPRKQATFEADWEDRP
ncbi:MAG: hypothetical protein IV105_03805 [Rhizobacter sp.]|nr:hypothetical protein [Rhizobacter sp.]